MKKILRLLIYVAIIEVSCCQDNILEFTNAAASDSLKTKRLKIKGGASVNLNCNKIKDDVIWEFKACDVNYRGINCGIDDKEVGGGDFSWKLLNSYKGKKILTLRNVSLDNTGIYRCISRNVIRKTFLVEIDAVTYEWPLPKVLNVVANDKIIHPNNHLTISCKVSSKSPPIILWFKECLTSICDMNFLTYEIPIGGNNNCLCVINDNHSLYNWENSYISKLHIANAHIWDSGTYVCSALSSDGNDFKNITIKVEEPQRLPDNGKNYILLLIFIPLILGLLYALNHIYCSRKNEKRGDPKQLHHLMIINTTPINSTK